MILNPHMLPKVRSDQIMASAAGQPCSLRISLFIPGLSCSPVSTTVGGHLPVFGKGVNTKVTDAAVAYVCFNCHRILDQLDSEAGQYHDFIAKNYPVAMMERMLFGLVETHARLIDSGIMVIPDARIV